MIKRYKGYVFRQIHRNTNPIEKRNLQLQQYYFIWELLSRELKKNKSFNTVWIEKKINSYLTQQETHHDKTTRKLIKKYNRMKNY